ncbi:MAG: hypothetical protein KJ072_25635 [Verrucomicrobia bacterium]|nr:hypothetical protein [Verrucomicrobiota bacterium]
MRTFAVREIDREPAAALDACDRERTVRIRRRNSRTYPYADTNFYTRRYLPMAESEEASGLRLRGETFWSFDPKASRLASLEGLKVR